ncbi:hypothetical protein [Acetatifactor aquisgranensis]|jgi:hypothetical protein|uniref:hypothetical protein n=1 Tax=Acetatifactor aquisgranensis TaxID=2941233 RepID=UPI002041907F|nr:hypothetical protein [Acetatifactor aquisgranensis]
MERGFDEKLTLDSETFSGMSRDYNFVLQRLLETMRDRDCDEGSITLNLKISLKSEYIPNYDPNVQGESREVKKPKFEHKISSSVKITDEKKGTLDTEMELVMDDDTGMYVLRPIVNTQQRSFFDDDMRGQFSGSDEPGAEAEGDGGAPALPGRKVLGLPGPDVIDGDFKEVAAEGPESPDSGGSGENDISSVDGEENAPLDATDALFEDEEGMEDGEGHIPFSDDDGDDYEDDGYGYEEPEED